MIPDTPVLGFCFCCFTFVLLMLFLTGVESQCRECCVLTSLWNTCFQDRTDRIRLWKPSKHCSDNHVAVKCCWERRLSRDLKFPLGGCWMKVSYTGGSPDCLQSWASVLARGPWASCGQAQWKMVDQVQVNPSRKGNCWNRSFHPHKPLNPTYFFIYLSTFFKLIEVTYAKGC